MCTRSSRMASVCTHCFSGGRKNCWTFTFVLVRRTVRILATYSPHMRRRRNDKTESEEQRNNDSPSQEQRPVSQSDADAEEIEAVLRNATEPNERPEVAAEAEIEALVRSVTDHDFAEEMERVVTYGREPSRPELEAEVRAAAIRLRDFFRKVTSDPTYGDATYRKLRRRVRAARRKIGG